MKLSFSGITGWISSILVAALTIMTGVFKFMPIETGSPQEAMMQSLHMTSTVSYTLGVIELLSAVLFLIPRTSVIGFVLLVGYYAGVLATLLTHGENATVGYIVLLLLTISAYFRMPELLSRVRKQG